jgi:hypothetical protein
MQKYVLFMPLADGQRVSVGVEAAAAGRAHFAGSAALLC